MQEQVTQIGALHMQIWRYNLYKLLTFHPLGALYSCWRSSGAGSNSWFWTGEHSITGTSLSVHLGFLLSHQRHFTLDINQLMLLLILASISDQAETSRKERNICFPGQQFGFADVFASLSLSSRLSNISNINCGHKRREAPAGNNSLAHTLFWTLPYTGCNFSSYHLSLIYYYLLPPRTQTHCSPQG